MKFKVGDKLRVINGHCGSFHDSEADWIIITTVGNNYYNYDIYKDNQKINCCYGCLKDENLELINNFTNNMNIKEKFVLALTSEPKKSFRKAGITNGDDLLTEEGQGVFLTWLLHSKYADEFKTAVVDDLLKNADRDL